MKDLETAQGACRERLEEAERLKEMEAEKVRQEAVGDLLREIIRVTRADTRLLEHPVVSMWIRQARAFGWRGFLRELPGNLGSKALLCYWSPRENRRIGKRLGRAPRPLTPGELLRLHEVDSRRYPRPQTGLSVAVEMADERPAASPAEARQGPANGSSRCELEGYVVQPMVEQVKALRIASGHKPDRKPAKSLSSIYEILRKNPQTRELLVRKSGRVMSYQYFEQLGGDGERRGKIGPLRL